MAKKSLRKKIITFTLNIPTYLLLRIFNWGYTMKEIQSREVNIKADEPRDWKITLGNVNTLSRVKFLHEQAKNYRQQEDDRRKNIEDKSKLLVTVATLLLAANGVVLSSIDNKGIGLIPFMSISAAVYLILVHFDVGKAKHIDYDMEYADRSERDILKEITEGIYQCSDQLFNRNNFRVAIFVAARRAIILGLLLLMAAFVYLAFNDEPKDNQNHVETTTIIQHSINGLFSRE